MDIIQFSWSYCEYGCPRAIWQEKRGLPVLETLLLIWSLAFHQQGLLSNAFLFSALLFLHPHNRDGNIHSIGWQCRLQKKK